MRLCFLVLIAFAFVLCIGKPGYSAVPVGKTPPGEIISHDDRVGIGTETPAARLDVYNGEIKVGSSGAACTKDLVGMIRFAADKLQVCNSHGWQSLAVAAPKQ
jgi:hypothetical protein